MQKINITIFLIIFISLPAFAQTIWDGPDTTFTKPDSADHTLAANQDSITPNVIITRANSGSIFNIAQESSANTNSPTDTKWALGTLDSVGSLNFQRFRAITSGGQGNIQLNNPMVLHLLSDDIYIEVDFTSWTSGQNGGGFSYKRTTEPPNKVNEAQKQNPVTVYPNPASDFIRVKGIEQSANLELWDITGRQLMTIPEYKGEKINLQNPEPGIYILTINNRHSVKIMVN